MDLRFIAYASLSVRANMLFGDRVCTMGIRHGMGAAGVGKRGGCEKGHHGAESVHIPAKARALIHHTTPRQQQWLVSLLVLVSGLLMVAGWDRHSLQQQVTRSKALAADLAPIMRSLCSVASSGRFLRPMRWQHWSGKGVARCRTLMAWQRKCCLFIRALLPWAWRPTATICCVVPLVGNEKRSGFQPADGHCAKPGGAHGP